MNNGDERGAIDDTRRWLERAVIGLNLCPFAKAVYVKQQVRFALSDAELEDDLLEELAEELLRLRDTPADEIDTTLLVHPHVLTDFLDYNDFLDRVDALIEALGLDGELQVALPHPASAARGEPRQSRRRLSGRRCHRGAQSRDDGEAGARRLPEVTGRTAGFIGCACGAPSFAIAAKIRCATRAPYGSHR
jgi:Protein of unknown function (DUF1415)